MSVPEGDAASRYRRVARLFARKVPICAIILEAGSNSRDCAYKKISPICAIIREEGIDSTRAITLKEGSNSRYYS